MRVHGIFVPMSPQNFLLVLNSMLHNCCGLLSWSAHQDFEVKTLESSRARQTHLYRPVLPSPVQLNCRAHRHRVREQVVLPIERIP